MTPVFAEVIIPGPDALPLPAPAGLLRLLLLVTFYLHLLAMNAMLGGIILTAVARLRSREARDDWARLADAVAGTTPVLVAATVTLGVAPLLFLQTLMGQFFFTSSILMGWGWFSVVVVLIFAYYGAYLQSFRQEKLGAARTPLLLVTAALFLWVGFMFSNNTSLMAAVGEWAGMYFADPGGMWLNLGDATLAPRYLHAVCGAVAVSGLMLAWWNRSSHMARTGLTAFNWATLTNVLLGVWYLAALPRPAMLIFMGRNPAATVLLVSAFVLTVAVVVLGFRGRNDPERVRLPITLVAAAIMAVMVLMRDMSRAAILTDHYRPADFAVKTQSVNLVVFVLMLLGGAAVVVWMVRALRRAWAG